MASERLTYTVPEAGRRLGVGRNSAYAAARRGEIPTVRIGRRLLVPRIELHRILSGEELRRKDEGVPNGS